MNWIKYNCPVSTNSNDCAKVSKFFEKRRHFQKLENIENKKKVNIFSSLQYDGTTKSKNLLDMDSQAVLNISNNKNKNKCSKSKHLSTIHSKSKVNYNFLILTKILLWCFVGRI